MVLLVSQKILQLQEEGRRSRISKKFEGNKSAADEQHHNEQKRGAFAKDVKSVVHR